MRISILYVFSIIFKINAYCIPNTSYIPPQSISILNACNTNCEEPYGKQIGINNNVISFSNCNSSCINRPGFAFKKELTSLIKDVWIGLPWQCVEYVRRWTLQNQNIEFDDVDYAYEVWNREKALDLKSGKEIVYKNFINGSERLPKNGDILVYGKNDELPYGHVAIITNVNIVDKYVDVAEENFQNKKWEDFNSYSRRIKLIINYIIKNSLI